MRVSEGKEKINLPQEGVVRTNSEQPQVRPYARECVPSHLVDVIS